MTMEQTEQIDTTPVGTDLPINDMQEEIPAEESTITPPEGEGIGSSPPPTVPAVQPSEEPTPTAQPQYTPQQMGQMQRDASEYQQVQANAALQQQANTYKEQLETQGYLPEQAQQVTDQVMRMQVENNNLSSSANAYGKHIQEKQFVVEHFVKKYNLGIDDMVSLRTYDNPKSMEDAAKKLSSDRERDSELSRFRQAQVPTQSFDNSQGNPQVAADEGSWLDRYNAGDRSPSAAAAAKRAAGIG
jgi:hypothetical protein